MPTLQQFTELIKPVTNNVKISMHVDKDRVLFLKNRVKFIQEKLESTNCSKLGSLGGQIQKLNRKRNEDYKVLYSAYKNEKKHGFGRVKPNRCGDVAYVSVTRPVRQFLVREFCTDIDIKNCHPVFMDQLYQMYMGRSLESLKKWNLHREDYFSLVISKSSKQITRDDAKKMSFTFMYEGDIDKTLKDLGLDKNDPDLSKIFDNLTELKHVAILLANQIKKDFPEMWDSIPSEKTGTHRERASKFSTLMQHLERRCADQLRMEAEKMGLLVHDICHDGILVSDDLHPLSDDVAQKLCCNSVTAISEECGFDVQVLAKEMDHHYATVLDKWFYSFRDIDNEVESDAEAVFKFLDKYQGRIVFSCGDWYIRPIGGFFWERGDAAVQNAIANCHFIKDEKPYGSDYRGIIAIFRTLCTRVDELTNNEFIAELNENLIGKVFWEDKHLDVSTGTLHVNNPTSTLAPIIYIHRPAPHFDTMSDNNDSMIRLNLLLQGMSDRQRIDYYQIIGRFAAGYLSDKQWVVLEGLRNTSKSSINNLVRKSFGEYVTSVSPPFIQRYDADSAAKNRWLITCSCHIKRIAIMAEKDTVVDKDGNPVPSVLDGNIIKKIIANGGNDTVVARNHCQGETQVFVNTGFIASFNGMPTANPPDALETIVPFSLEIKFTDDESLIKAHPQLYMKRDPVIADYVNDPEVWDYFIWCCLVRHYQHHKFQPELGTMADDLAEIKSTMGEQTPLSIYTQHCIREGKLNTEDALTFFRSHLDDPTFSLNKLTRFMTKMGHPRIKGSVSYYKDVSIMVDTSSKDEQS